MAAFNFYFFNKFDQFMFLKIHKSLFERFLLQSQFVFTLFDNK